MSKSIEWITILCLVSIRTTLHAQVDVQSGGEATASTIQQRYVIQSADINNVRVVDDPNGGPRSVLQVRVGSNDPRMYGGYRSEVVPLREYIKSGTRWYAISAYFPADWEIRSSPAIFGQLHTSQKGLPLSPPVALLVEGTNVYIDLHANHRSIESVDTVTRKNTARQRIRVGQLQTNTWMCFVIKADWSSRIGEGSLGIWLNGQQIYESENLFNMYETWLGNYPKTGLYFPGNVGGKDRTIFVDFIHVGGNRSTLAEMMTKTPCSS